MNSLSYGEHQCDSILEMDWWHQACKRESAFDWMQAQYPVGRYRMDAAVCIRGRIIGIELDGTEFHEPMRDDIRDREILTGGVVSEIIRIPFAAMHYFPDGTMAVVGTWHPEFKRQKPPMTCMSVEGLREEIAKMKEPGALEDFRGSLDKFIEEIDSAWDVYDVSENYGRTAGPKAFLRGHFIRPIVRKT